MNRAGGRGDVGGPCGPQVTDLEGAALRVPTSHRGHQGLAHPVSSFPPGPAFPSGIDEMC